MSSRARRMCPTLVFLAFATIALAGCKLEYDGEEFSLKIKPDGSGELAVTYLNFGSQETMSHLRRKDLDALRDLAQNPEHVKKAAGDGVTITSRRLDFVESAIHGYAEASARQYADLFKVFTNYKLEISNKIYIIPMNGAVLRATLSEGGVITVKNKRYAFAWPLEATDISFKATYKTGGARYIFDLEKQMEKK
ncbi:MAG: hypothetical protein HZB29_05575 [Nitrospinae bacterium]|nr:hypothetical protein [Nitrospinota bacterium]